MSTRKKSIKLMGNTTVKMRQMEEKHSKEREDWEREKRRLWEENRQLKERLEVHRNMNFNLQKLQTINKKKAEQADNLLKRCVDLEDAN
jgi:UDP-N-acetylglucosamine 2-epimerase